MPGVRGDQDFKGAVRVRGALTLDSGTALAPALVAAGAGLDIDATMTHATGALAGIDVTAAQLTTARTGGTVSGVKIATTSLAGDLNSVVYADLRLAAPTDGGGAVVHTAIVVEAGHDVLLDCSGMATGQADIVIGDNLAEALVIREGSNAYLSFASTNGGELITAAKRVVASAGVDGALGGVTPAAASVTTLAASGVVTLQNRLVFGLQSIDMADATHTLILSGTPTAGQTLLAGNALVVNPSSGGAGEDLILPTTALCVGLVLFIFSGGSQNVVIKDSGGSTIVTILPGKGVVIGCNGSGWGNILGS